MPKIKTTNAEPVRMSNGWMDVRLLHTDPPEEMPSTRIITRAAKPIGKIKLPLALIGFVCFALAGWFAGGLHF